MADINEILETDEISDAFKDRIDIKSRYIIPESAIVRNNAEDSIFRKAILMNEKNGFEIFLEIAKANGISAIEDLPMIAKRCNPTFRDDRVIVNSDVFD